MKVAIFGATGLTGKLLVKQCLDNGHRVLAIVRTAAKLDDIKNVNLEVQEANLFESKELIHLLKDADVVFSTLGFPLKPSPVTGYTLATKSIVETMRCYKTHSKRLILMHSWYTDPETRGDASFFSRWVVIPIIKTVLNGMNEAEEFLKTECGDITWTTVLPPGLSNSSVTDKEIFAEEGRYFLPDKSTRMARADVARYLIKVAEEDLHKQNCVAISV